MKVHIDGREIWIDDSRAEGMKGSKAVAASIGHDGYL